MKNVLKVIVALMFVQTSFAATSGQLNLSGIVPSRLSIVVNPEAVATNLDLSTTQANLKVAAVTERSNHRLGYTVAVKSSNNGVLAHEDGVANGSVAYTLKYGTFDGTLTTADQTAVDSNNIQLPGLSRDVEISYTGDAPENMRSGTYSDIVTFTITAK